MVGVGEFLASAALKQVGGMLGSAIWEAIASQLKLGDELKGLKDTVDAIQNSMVRVEKRLMKDGDVCVWMRELKAAAYDMDDIIMEFEGAIPSNKDDSQNNKSTTEISIPLKLRLSMPRKLKAMKQRLDNIEKLRRFDLMVDTSSDDQDVIQTRATGPCLVEGILGRDKDKVELMKLLQEDCKHTIIPIYGFGGLGKTTLAQMVFDDNTTKRDFDIQIWVYVSTSFSDEKIGRSIISQVDGQSNQYDLSSVQMRVEMILRGKKYLIVLDDLWEENTGQLQKIKAMLKGGAPGRKIIVTTRSEQVAKRMNRELPFKLGALPYDDCWKLFKAKAFPNGIKESEMAKVHMGEKIVKKCDGVPLAVKSLGDRLLDMPMHKWEETLKSDLWEHERDPTTGTTSTAILPSLKISYYHMPYYLRPCFVYFSAFPKGFVIEKRELIHKWIALRFVLTTHRAEEYLQELCQMSFLEATSDSISISARYSKLNNPHNVLFKMHDLVHELARSVAIEEVAICDGKQGSFGPKKDNYRYTLLLNFKGQHPKCKDMPFKARAAHFSGCTGCQPSKGAFSETKWLRVLDFPRMQTVELPSSMENLHHLQFLNLSENTSLKKLHSSFSKKVKLHSSTSICDFQKLHYLDLHGCSNLSELPGPIHRLQVLEHLDLSGCTSLQKLPSQFGELQKLSFLNLSCCSKLEMLPDSFSLLKNLEHLNLSSCCQLKQLRTLSFKRMKGLLYLNMSGCTCLEALPEFCVGNDGCLNLEILDLSDCARLIDLSESCARLNKLRFLNLSGCPCIPKIICFLSKFVNLEYLNLSALSGFDVRKDSEAPSSSTQHSSDYSGEELSLKMLHDTLKNMHCLEYLSVGGMSLFSKEGISSDLLILPDFVVSERGSGDCSNIILLQNILDSTNSELNIKCLEVVKSSEEAKGVQLGRRHRLASLSLEWSSLEWSEEPTVTTRDVLENLKPHPALKHLTVKGYNYSMFPSWMREICSTLPNLVKLVLSDLIECDQLPTLGNLSNLEELEIRNMPKLMEACLAPCRNLKRLSLVELAFGCTLWFCQDGSALRTNRSSEEIHDMELDPSEESKRLEVFRTQSGDPSRGKGKAKLTAMARNKMGTFLGVTKKRTQMTHVPVSSSAPCPAKEAFPPLCYLKIEHCNYLKLKPRIPNSQEFFINKSSIPTFTRITSDDLESVIHKLSMPTLTRINSGDLVIEQTIQKLKISNCKSFDLQKLPGIQSVHEFEIDCLEKFHHFYELRCMDRLVKLTLSSPENFLHTDKAEILKAIPHIQCIKINGGMYFAVQESDFLLLRQNTDFGITDLFISNLEKVNSADEVGLGELATYDQLRTLRLVWSHDANSYSSNGLSGSEDRPNNVYLNLGKKFSRADDSSVLQRLHPHPNLSTLQIEGYRDATFCGWMSDPNLYLPNLVKIELMGMPRCARLPSLGQLANLEELHISDMPNIREVDTSFYGGRDPFRKLRELCINKMENLEVLSTNLELSAGEMSWDDDEQKVQGDEIFPRLAHLVVTGCPRLTLGSAFQGYIGRIVASCSEVELSPGILVGSSHLFRLEVEPNIFGFSDASEFLQYSTDLRNLTIKSDSDLITLPEIIRSCHSLRSLQILDSCNFAALPDWLGDLASLEELEVHSAKLQRLPHSIKDVTSLKTLTLKKCNYKLRECCSRLGEDYDKIKHIKHVDAHEGTSFAIDSSNDMAILQKTTSHQLIELNIEHLEYLSSSEANIIELAQKEELQFLSLEWSELQFSLEWFNPVSNKVALEELQPHQNLKRLCIKNYVGGDYPNWLRLLPNLVRLELFNVQSGHLHLDYLQSLEDLYISSVSVFEVMKYRPDVLDLYAKSSICILSTQPVKNLRRVTIVRVGKLLWETSTSHCIEQKDDKNIFQREQEGRHSDTGRESSYQRTLFPRLQYLEIDCCLNVRFEPSIPWSARYIISGIKQYPFLFNWPSFYQVMGLSTSALSSKMEIKYFENIYSDSDSLQLLDIEELTVDSCIDPVPLPQCILGWKSLRKLEILNCRGIDGLPDWLGDMASLRELKVETYWMKTLPPCIERLTSLHTLTLSQCTKRLKQRCSESGDDWSKIKHIENVQVELRP